MKKKILIIIGLIIFLCMILTLILIRKSNRNTIIISKNNLYNVAGASELTYVIYKNGDIYVYTHRNKDMEYSEINNHEFIKNISNEEHKEIYEKLEKLSKSEYVIDNYLNCDWSFKIYGHQYYVKNIDLYQYVLEKHLDNDYEKTIEKRDLEKSIYDFIKEKYHINQSDSDSSKTFPLTEEDKNTLLEEYKNENPYNSYTDDELKDIIDNQAFMILREISKDENL